MRRISRDDGQDQDCLRDDAAFPVCGTYGDVRVKLLLGQQVFRGIRCDGEEYSEEIHW
jgi:hypothetical protein